MKNRIQEESKDKKNIFLYLCVIGVVVALGSIIFFMVLLFNKQDLERKKTEETYREIVAEELGLEKKYVKYAGREFYFLFLKDADYIYETDQEKYSVEFTENEIKTIIKQ